MISNILLEHHTDFSVLLTVALGLDDSYMLLANSPATLFFYDFEDSPVGSPVRHITFRHGRLLFFPLSSFIFFGKLFCVAFFTKRNSIFSLSFQFRFPLNVFFFNDTIPFFCKLFCLPIPCVAVD
jgi:hypothetical protein